MLTSARLTGIGLTGTGLTGTGLTGTGLTGTGQGGAGVLPANATEAFFCAARYPTLQRILFRTLRP